MKTRKQIRLKDYDYSKDGFYFITICSKNRENIFGDVIVGADGCRPVSCRPAKVALNDFGRIVDEELEKSLMIRKEIVLDQYVVIPNHVHCIIVIEQNHIDLRGRQGTGRPITGRPITG
jgi:REP element-mobilizing transposase RayT